MITCPNCGKENQDHYKFCLGCGAKLPAASQAPAPPVMPPPMAGPPKVPPPAGYAAPPAPAPGPYGQPQQGVYAAPPAAPPPYMSANPYAPPPAQAAPIPRPMAPPPPGIGPAPVAPPPAFGGPPQPYASPAPVPAAAAPAAPAIDSGPRPCPNCQTPNPAQFKFCGACGNPLAPPAPAPAPAAAAPVETAARTMFMDANAPHPAAPAPAPTPRAATARLVLLREDGTEGGVLVIEGGPERIGRSYGPPFDSDAYLSPEHAELSAAPEGLIIDDCGSLNGVFLKLEGRADLEHGDLFRVGQELLLFEDLPEPTPTADGTERMGSPNPAYWGRVSIMVSPDRVAEAFPVKEQGVDIGRENGHITFPDDGYVSGSHCRIVGDEDGVWLEDLGSSNGTYLRVRRGQLMPTGTLILIGQQLFRIDPGV